MMESVEFGNPSRRLEDSLDKYLLRNKKKKVMVIDDDLEFRLLVSEILVNEGYSVMTAKDGEAGLNQLIHNQDRPDLIFLDLNMPIKGGWEFRKEQLQMADISHIPVVFLTGHGYVEGEATVLKPLGESDVIDAVKRFL